MLIFNIKVQYLIIENTNIIIDTNILYTMNCSPIHCNK